MSCFPSSARPPILQKKNSSIVVFEGLWRCSRNSPRKQDHPKGGGRRTTQMRERREKQHRTKWRRRESSTTEAGRGRGGEQPPKTRRWQNSTTQEESATAATPEEWRMSTISGEGEKQHHVKKERGTAALPKEGEGSTPPARERDSSLPRPSLWVKKTEVIFQKW